MHRILTFIPVWACILFLLSCSEDEKTYPSIITEFAEMKADDKGMAKSITLDDGRSYGITNQIADLKPGANYRVVCGYVADNQQASIYSLDPAYVLRDSVKIARHDPTGVLSAWRSGRFINLHLRPKTQGGTQYWGYITDSITAHHAHLSLHHRQMEDPTSYSCDIYASLPIDSIQGITIGDTISLRIKTFNGAKIFTFKR